jgi:hypothetical protein
MRMILFSLSSQLTLLVGPLHLRVLLDLARLKIIESCGYESWEQLRGTHSITQLTDRVATAVGLSQDLSKFLCEFSNVRRAGNKAAHMASAEDIRNAVLQKDVESSDRKLLEQIYQFVFDRKV